MTLDRTLRAVLETDRRALHHAADAVLDGHGWPTSTTGTGRRSSEVARPTEAAACAALDDGDASDVTAARILRDAEARLLQAGLDWLAASRRLTPTVIRDRHRPGVGSCEACDQTCEGATPADRLRSGLCPACWQGWLRWQDATPTLPRTWDAPDSPLRPGTLVEAADRVCYVRARRRKLDAQGKLDGATLDVTPVRDRREPVAIGTMAHIHDRLGSPQ